MTNVKPATDYMVGSIQKAHRHCSTTECGDVLVLLARVDADREAAASKDRVIEQQAEEIAQLKGENAQLIEVYDHAQTGLKSMRAEAGKMREEIAYLKARYERDMCADGHERIRYTPDEDFGPCPVCVLRAEISKDGEVAALNAAWSRDMGINPPVTSAEARQIVATSNRERAREIAALRADQSDWRKGVGFIASALGIDSLSCVDIAERGLEIRAERDALKAEVERPRCNDLLCRCCARRAR